MWTVSTRGDLPDELEERAYTASAPAWLDYWGRILELEIHGFDTPSEEVVKYGREWACQLFRGAERIRITIEHAA